MVFHLERLVEWRHPSLAASIRVDIEETGDFVRVRCPTCELGYLGAPTSPEEEDVPSASAAAGALHLEYECPDHAAQFSVSADM